MRFGIQRFLNPVDSADSGYVKLSIRPKSDDYNLDEGYVNAGHSVTWQVADCSEKVYLEFSYGGRLDFGHFQHTIKNVRSMLSDIKKKRAKMKRFLDAVNKVGNKYLEALDADEALMLEYIKKKREFDAKRKADNAKEEKR